MKWIVDWSEVEDSFVYLVLPINSRGLEKHLAVGNQGHTETGIAVKRYLKGQEGKYALCELPPCTHTILTDLLSKLKTS